MGAPVSPYFFSVRSEMRNAHIYPPSRTNTNKFNIKNSLIFFFGSKRNAKRSHFLPSRTKTNTNGAPYNQGTLNFTFPAKNGERRNGNGCKNKFKSNAPSQKMFFASVAVLCVFSITEKTALALKYPCVTKNIQYMGIKTKI